MITIETVNSELHTVVWNNRPKDWIDGGMPQCQVRRWSTEHGYTLYDADYRRIGTALKSLPRKCDVKRDERLWYAYASMGVDVRGRFFCEADSIDTEDGVIEFEEKWCEDSSVLCEPVEEVTHGIFNKERCEVAIYDND